MVKIKREFVEFVPAVALIPVRLFLFAAVAFDFQQLPVKFIRLFPLLVVHGPRLGAVPVPSYSSFEPGFGAGADSRTPLYAVCSARSDSDVCSQPNMRLPRIRQHTSR